jgi:hypothetical protein
MGNIFLLYNLNFDFADDFENFSIAGYSFYPIPHKQPQKRARTSGYILKSPTPHEIRSMNLNARIIIPKKQKDSVFRKGGTYSQYRRIKFLDDLLVIISICIRKNVVPKFYEKFDEFPVCALKNCERVSKNSKELKQLLEIIIWEIQKSSWLQKYDGGYHIKNFYHAGNIYIGEPRFLADITIWEFLYYCDHRTQPYEWFNSITLNTKINYLVKKYLLNTPSAIPEERLKIFSDMRNQLSHHGKLPIQNPKSPFKNLGFIGCHNYWQLFMKLTQALVFKTLGIDIIDKLNVRGHLDELIIRGSVQTFHEKKKLGLEW